MTIADRWASREALLVLMSRAERGALLESERPLLRPLIEAQLAEADQARRTAGGLVEENRRLRQRIADLQRAANPAERSA